MALRRPVLTLALAAAAATAAAAPGPAAPAAPVAPVATARVATCDVQARTAAFVADMRWIPGAERLQMRFVLQLRAGRWERVEAPTFGRWTSADPGRLRYVYEKRVERLTPGAFRVVVRFRWRDAAGEVLRTATRRSRPCRVPDPRPDLVPVGVDVGPGASADTRAYAVTVANEGRGAAPPFAVSLTVDGVALQDRTSPALRPGERGSVVFTGPPCPAGGVLVAAVDATGVVPEAREDDDTLTVPCGG